VTILDRKPRGYAVARTGTGRSSALLVCLLLGGAASPTLVEAEGSAPTRLALAEFVQQAVLRNAAVQAARLQADAAGRLVQAERALYDPILVGRARRELSDRPRTFEERTSGPNVGKESAIEQLGTASTGLRGKLPSGATYEFGYELRRRASNLLGSDDVRESRGTLTLTIKQPLLRSYGRAATEADLRVSEKEQQVEAQRFVKQLADLVADAGSTYWQLHRAEQTLRMRERALDVARELQADVRRRVEGGMAPRVELQEAELTLGARQAEVLRARQLGLEARARARVLLGVDAATSPDGVPGTLPGAPLSVPEAASESGTPPPQLLDGLPAVRIARLRLEQEQVRLDHARRQEQPDLSVEVGVNRNSLADSTRRGFEQSLGSQHPGYYAGLLLEMPLDNGAARARREGQGLRRDAARLQVEAEERAARNEWEARHGQWTASLGELALLGRELLAREALLTAELENYQSGRSRLRQLVEAQDRLGESRLRELDAAVRARLAEIALRASAGELFGHFGLKLGD